MGLKQKTVSGLIWTGAGTIGNGLISFLVIIILARILLPYHFALIELLVIFVAISNVIVDSGFSQAIIRDDNPSEKDLSSVFYFNIALSFSLYILLFFAAPYISNYFETPELTLLARVVFLVIIFNSFSIIQNATLNRSLNFAAVNKSSVIGSFLAGGISLIMAFTGLGIWALVANMVLLPFFRSIFLWYQSNWRPKKIFSFKSIKKYFAFGGFLMLQGIIDTIVTNITSFIIGKVYTKNDLGYYSQGGKLNGYIVNPLVAIISKVTYPILSKVKNEEERLKDIYSKVMGLVVFIILPFSIFLCINSENTIVFLFGEKWRPAAIYLSLFAVFGMFSTLQSICMNIIMVKGKTKTLFYFAFVKQSVRLLVIILVIPMGVLAIASANIITSVIASIFYIGLGMYYLNYSIKDFLKDIYKTIISSLLLVISILASFYLLKDSNIYITISTQILIMLLVYLGSSIFLKNVYINEIYKILIPLTNKVFKKDKNEKNIQD